AAGLGDEYGKLIHQVVCRREKRGTKPELQPAGDQDRVAAGIAHPGQDLERILQPGDGERGVVGRGAIRGIDDVSVTGRVQRSVRAGGSSVESGDELRDSAVASDRETVGQI